MYKSIHLTTLCSHQLYCNGQPLRFGTLHSQVIELLAYLNHHPGGNLWPLQAALYPEATPKQVQSWLQLVNQGLIEAKSPVQLMFSSNTSVALSQTLHWDAQEYLQLDHNSGFGRVYHLLLGYRGPLLPTSNSPWVVGLRERLRLQLLTVGAAACSTFSERARMYALLEQKVPTAGAWLAAERGMAGQLPPYEDFELFGLGS
jgi:two-component SAPR family response regulator